MQNGNNIIGSRKNSVYYEFDDENVFPCCNYVTNFAKKIHFFEEIHKKLILVRLRVRGTTTMTCTLYSMAVKEQSSTCPDVTGLLSTAQVAERLSSD